MQEITEDVLCSIAGMIEKLLLEQRDGIAFAYQKIPDGIKLSIGVNIDTNSQGLNIDYSLSYPLEPKPEAQLKEKVTKKQIINDGQQMEIL